jgi:hypothetical protein
MKAPKLLVRIAGLWDSEARGVIRYWGITKTYDNSTTKSVLGIEFRDLKDSI